MLTKEQNQLIDKYFSKKDLSENEKAEFNQLLNGNKDFEQEIDFRESLHTSLKRHNARISAQKRIKKAKTYKNLKTIGIATAVLAVITAGVVLFAVHLLSDKAYENPYAEALIMSDNTTKLDVVKGEEFAYNSEKPLVIESDNGTVVVVPQNAFVDANGNKSDAATIKLQEYLKPTDILLAGLSTESDGKPLESGGMFNITAKDADGKPLAIKEGKEILFEVPTAERKTGMQVFDGKEDSTGNINWVNPQKLENYLTTVVITTLDFYPPNYLKKLDELGYGNKSKHFKDSLFYSFYCSKHELETEIEEVISIEFNDSSNINVRDNFENHTDTKNYKTSKGCGITPAQIKTIWNKKYQNTYLATKEFEERLKVLYTECDKDLLSIYIKNMHRPMSVADNKVFKKTGNYKFRQFYNRGTGTVKMKDELLQTLNKYYQKKSKVFHDIAKISYEDYHTKQYKLDQEANKKLNENNKANHKRKYENYWSEYEHNLNKANKDLGTKYKFKKGVGVVSWSDGTKYSKYKFRITTLGAKNIDRFMSSVLANRETQTFTEKNGKTTTLSFKKIDVTLPVDSFDLVRVYFTSPTLYSFIKAKGKDGSYNYSINLSMDYNLVVVTQKLGKTYIYGSTNIKDSVNLTMSDLKEVESLDKELKPYSSNISKKGISDDIDYKNFLKKDALRKKKRSNINKLRTELQPIVFPCQNKAEGIDIVGLWRLIDTDNNKTRDHSKNETFFLMRNNGDFKMLILPFPFNENDGMNPFNREVVYHGETYWCTLGGKWVYTNKIVLLVIDKIEESGLMQNSKELKFKIKKNGDRVSVTFLNPEGLDDVKDFELERVVQFATF